MEIEASIMIWHCGAGWRALCSRLIVEYSWAESYDAPTHLSSLTEQEEEGEEETDSPGLAGEGWAAGEAAVE